MRCVLVTVFFFFTMLKTKTTVATMWKQWWRRTHADIEVAFLFFKGVRGAKKNIDIIIYILIISFHKTKQETNRLRLIFFLPQIWVYVLLSISHFSPTYNEWMSFLSTYVLNVTVFQICQYCVNSKTKLLNMKVCAFATDIKFKQQLERCSQSSQNIDL